MACNCCGVPPCPPSCEDGNLCTSDYCEVDCGYSYCAHESRNCDDGALCTNDWCVPSTGVCQHSVKVCTDGIVCTHDWCDPSSGSCMNTPYCTGGVCCPDGQSFSCCWPPTTQCCAEPDHCCEPTQTCCGTNQCCNTNQSCCNGDCRQGCQTTCCDWGWCEGECCNGTCCGLSQICCNGACCGSVCNPGSCECADSECLTYTCETTPACDDDDPCTDDICTPGQCGDFTCDNPCKPMCSTNCNAETPGFWCNPCDCQQEDCTVSLSSATGKPCETVNLTLTADCWPCGMVEITLEPQYPPPYNTVVSPWLDISSPAPVDCQNGPPSQTIQVTIHEDAPPGPVPIRVTGTTASGQTCEETGTVTVDRTYPPVEIQYKTFIAPAAIAI